MSYTLWKNTINKLVELMCETTFSKGSLCFKKYIALDIR